MPDTMYILLGFYIALPFIFLGGAIMYIKRDERLRKEEWEDYHHFYKTEEYRRDF